MVLTCLTVRLSRTYRAAVYCYGVRETGMDEWNFLATQYAITKDIDDQRDML